MNTQGNGSIARQRTFTRAFTLLELLVIIAILALLAVTVLPALAKVSQRSQPTVCMNNVRQLGLAFQLYAHDNNGWYPGWGWEFLEPGYAFPADRVFNFSGPEGDLPHGLLWEYVKSTNVFQCPAYALREINVDGNSSEPLYRWWGENGHPPGTPPYPTYSYVQNGQAARSLKPVGSADLLDLKVSALHTAPATTFRIYEEDDDSGSPFDNGIDIFALGAQPIANDHLETKYHAGVGNLGFMDGHTESMNREQWTNHLGTLQSTLQFVGGSIGYYWSQNP